jgi:hypothetical protein
VILDHLVEHQILLFFVYLAVGSALGGCGSAACSGPGGPALRGACDLGVRRTARPAAHRRTDRLGVAMIVKVLVAPLLALVG